jgi:sugar/nucleoside kinase (ribokinase family)
VALAVLTQGANGSTILRGGEKVEVVAEPAQIVDTTGAGDAYAAGFLAALTADKSLAQCGKLASIAAADVIGQYGARPRTGLSGALARL